MGITFALRGDDINARYSKNGKAPGSYTAAGTIASVSSVLTGAIGGKLIDCNLASGSNKWLWYSGGTNLPTGQAISVLWSGTVDDIASFMGLFTIGGMIGLTAGELNLTSSNANTLNTNIYTEANVVSVNNVSKAWAPATGTIYDIVLTWNGTTGANSVEIFVNAVSIGTITPTQAWAATKNLAMYPTIYFGAIGNPYIKYKLREFVIWDSVIVPSSVALTGGTGSLNGNTRSQFVDVISYDGSIYVYPAASDIRSTAAGLINAGVAVTPTAVIPTAANVRSGTAVDATTGTMIMPARTDVRLSTAMDNTTGLMDLPQQAVVVNGVTFDGATKTGTYKALTLNQFLALK